MLPMRLGLDSMESERSRTKSLARSRAVLANTSEGTRASKESHEPVPCGKRCEAGLDETHPVCRRENRHLEVQSVQNAVFFGHHLRCTTRAVCGGGTL